MGVKKFNDLMKVLLKYIDNPHFFNCLDNI